MQNGKKKNTKKKPCRLKNTIFGLEDLEMPLVL